MRELHQLRQQVGDLDQFRQATVQEREQQSLQTAQQQIESFRNAKGDDGQPKHPHFDAVLGHVVSLLEAGNDLDSAYAIATKPITDAVAAREAQDRAAREASEAQARQAREAAEKERVEKLTRAQRAGGPRPTGSRPGMTQSADVISNAWEAMRKVGLAT
jgi:predicted metal-dependent hydrolase